MEEPWIRAPSPTRELRRLFRPLRNRRPLAASTVYRRRLRSTRRLHPPSPRSLTTDAVLQAGRPAGVDPARGRSARPTASGGPPGGNDAPPIPSGGARPHGPAEEVRAEGDMVLLVCVGQEIPDHHRRPAGDRNLHPYPLKHPLHRGRPSRRQPSTDDTGRRARVLRTHHIRVIPHIIWFLNCNC